MPVHASSRIGKGKCPPSPVSQLVVLKILLFLGTIIVTSTSAFSQTSTATSLALTSGGNSVTSIPAGAMVTLTASVSAGSTVVSQGQVNFCDAAATYCTDTHLLGTAQLTSAGQAQLHLHPAVGNYSYKAVFLARPRTTVAYSSSTSGVINLTVSGKLSTATIIAQSGASGDYTLTATVLGFTKSPTLSTPGGVISFLDTTTNNSVLGMGTLAAASGPAWVNVSSPGVGSLPNGVLAGDFNGDGNLDLAVGINTVSGSGALSASILLGDGQGNFTSAPVSSVAGGGVPAAVADFNQDGVPDLLLSNASTGTLVVALGNGDGTFAQAAGSPLISNYGVFPVAIADFNGDGIPDIAAGGGYYLIIWLGKGDGTFTQVPISSSLAAPNLAAMIVGDFNGDGIADLAGGGETVSVYLGKGDGTFMPGKDFVVTTVHSGIAPNLTAGDFNGDGKLDVAVPIPFSGVIAILLGNGDGTFQAAASNPTVGQWANRVAVGDFNGDGISDILVDAETNLTNIFILLGNGDGTFSVVSNGPPQQPCCWSTAVADLNGDRLSDFASADVYANVVDVFLTGAKQSTAAITGVSVTGQSPQQVIASYPGDTNYSSSQSASTSLLAQATPPVFAPASGGIVPVGQTIVLTSPTPGATIYYQGSGAIQTNGYVQYFSSIALYYVGNVTIQAYATGINYGDSAVSTATFTVVSSAPIPALTFTSPAFASAGGQGFTLTINGSGFMSTSTIYFGTTALPTQFVSSNQVTAQVTSAAIASAGIKPITVQNPAPGGGISNAVQFEVDSGSATPPVFAATTATVTAGSNATFPVTLPSSATGISVQCLNMPSGASCSYSAGSGALTITTSGSTPAGMYPITAVFTETLPGASGLVASALLLLPFGFVVLDRKRRCASIVATGVMLLLLAATSCGGGSGGGGGTQPQSHQATSSGVVTLIVQ